MNMKTMSTRVEHKSYGRVHVCSSCLTSVVTIDKETAEMNFHGLINTSVRAQFLMPAMITGNCKYCGQRLVFDA